jgi:tetratricopeptide (TPR) repeat protein
MLATEVSQAIAKRDAGDLDPFIAQRPKLEPRVLASDDPELVASWQLAVGRTFEERGDEKLARDPLRRAAEAATTARRDDIAAHAWSELAGVLARAGELEGADNLMVAARGAATRVDRPIVAVWLELADGAIAVERGDFAGAMTKCTHAGDAAKRIGDLRGLELDAIGCVYDAQMGNSDFAGAVTSARRRKDIATALFGPDNVSVLEARRAIATALARNGDQAGAVAEWDAVLAGMEKTYGANSLEMMRTLRDYAASQSPGGAETTPKAVAAIRRAAAIADAGHPAAGEHSGILESLGYVESANHDLEASTAAYERAIAILEKLDDPMALARVLYNTADGLKEGKQCDRALPLFDRAARVAASTGQKSMMEAGALYGRGACLGRAKQWDVADDSLRRAFDQFDKLELPLFAAQARWELADQLVMRGKRAEGLAIAKAAADQLAGLPPPAEDLRKQILDWIKKP